MSKKTCSLCSEEKGLCNYYSQNKKKKDGTEYVYYQPYCKECCSKKAAGWKEDNPERVIINRRNLKIRDPERVRMHRRKSYENNLKTEKETLRNWQKENPDQVKYHNQKRLQHKKHKISNKEWESCKNYFNYRCAYCDLKIEEHLIMFKGRIQLGDFHKEHFNHEGANDLSNCVPACKSCNSSKGDYDFEDWFKMSGQFSNSKRDKIIKWINEDYKQYIQLKTTKKYTSTV